MGLLEISRVTWQVCSTCAIPTLMQYGLNTKCGIRDKEFGLKLIWFHWNLWLPFPGKNFNYLHYLSIENYRVCTLFDSVTISESVMICLIAQFFLIVFSDHKQLCFMAITQIISCKYWYWISRMNRSFLVSSDRGRISITCTVSALGMIEHASKFLPEASFGLRVLSSPLSVYLSVCVCVCVCINHLLVRTITHQPFKLESPNLKHRCKTPWLRSLLFWGVIDLELQGQI